MQLWCGRVVLGFNFQRDFIWHLVLAYDSRRATHNFYRTNERHIGDLSSAQLPRSRLCNPFHAFIFKMPFVQPSRSSDHVLQFKSLSCDALSSLAKYEVSKCRPYVEYGQAIVTFKVWLFWKLQGQDRPSPLTCNISLRTPHLPRSICRKFVLRLMFDIHSKAQVFLSFCLLCSSFFARGF